MIKFADLHIHTYYSDSTLSPEDIVHQATQHGLSCISITDHDTIDAIDLMQELSKPSGLETIAGVELSSEANGKDIHILGYFLQGLQEHIVQRLVKIQEFRIERIKKMVQKLKDLGINGIEVEEVLSLTKSKSVGRPHLAAVLHRKGFVSSPSQAFAKYIGEQGPAYVAKYKQSVAEAIELIKGSKGIAVLAHPVVTNRDELIPSFVEAGLDGIEVYHPKHSASAVRYYERIAKKHGLLMTGGSDAHGKAKEDTYIGKTKIPYSFVEQLKTYKKY